MRKKRDDIKIRCQNRGICLTFIIWKHIFVFINTLFVFCLQHNKCFGVKYTQIFLLFGTHLLRDIAHSFNVFIICTYFGIEEVKTKIHIYNLLNIPWVSRYRISFTAFNIDTATSFLANLFMISLCTKQIEKDQEMKQSLQTNHEIGSK